MNNDVLLSQVIKTELDEVFYQNWSQYQSFPGTATADTGAIFKSATSDHGAYIGDIYKGPGLFDVVGEEQVVPNDTFRATNKYTIYPLMFAKTITLSKQLFDDNMHGVWAETVAQAAIMARQTQNANAFKIFRLGFTTYLSADGVSLFNSAHPLIGGGTQSNTGTGALSPSTLNTAIINLRTQKNQAGVLMGSTPSVLLVPAALWKHAVEITESALIADSAQNNLNVYRSALGITVYSSPWLDANSVSGEGSDTAWFLLSDTHGIRRWVRQGIQTALVGWEYSSNLDYSYKINFREEVFAVDYSGTYGSTGVS